MRCIKCKHLLNEHGINGCTVCDCEGFQEPRDSASLADIVARACQDDVEFDHRL